LRLSSFGGYGLALAALALVVFGAYDSCPYVFWSVFKIDLCSAKSMESSRRDLLNDMTEHMSNLKNNQNTYHPRVLVSYPKQVWHSAKRDLVFTGLGQP